MSIRADPVRPRHHWPRHVTTVLVCCLAALQVLGWLIGAPKVGHFRSHEDRTAYIAAYDEALATMPTPTHTLDVPTSYGTVRVYEWRADEDSGDPVLLLPGRGSGVPMWSENVEHLIGERTVYAVDAIGDAGMSTQSVPITDMAAQATWIDDTLTSLGVERAHIVGHSFGGATAAALAITHPERVTTLTLLEPAFVLGLPPVATLVWSVPASLPFLPQSWRDTALLNLTGEDPGSLNRNDPVTAMILRGGTGYSAELPTPTPLSEEELKGLPMPVHIALAEASTITGGETSEPKAELIPDVTVKIWPDTSHSLPMQVAEPLSTELLSFWTSHD